MTAEPRESASDLLRSEMGIVDDWACFDHASVAPITRPAAEALSAWANDYLMSGVRNWNRWRAKVESCRKSAARLIRTDPGNMALIRNTTEGINIAAAGVPWRSGDNVLVPECEFPSNLYPWLILERRGVEVRRISGPPESLLDNARDCIDRRTRLISVSWVDYAAGYRQDLSRWCELTRESDALLFVDAIQGLGAFSLDVSDLPIDFLAADGHKWMLGPEGAGLLFASDRALELLEPVGIGWNSVVHAGDFTNHDLTLKPDAGRFEGGTYNTGGIAALGASLDVLLKCGTDAVANAVLHNAAALTERLRTLGFEISRPGAPKNHSGIVSAGLSGCDPDRLAKECAAGGVIVIVRNGRLRFSPHAYNSADDLDRLTSVLNESLH